MECSRLKGKRWERFEIMQKSLDKMLETPERVGR